MEHPFNVVLYGGDYNPEQWPKEIWKEDLRLFDLAGINSATVNVFSWAKLQPSEEEYNFAELDEIIDMLSKANIQIVLATSTGAMPGWTTRAADINSADGTTPAPTALSSSTMPTNWRTGWRSATAAILTWCAGT